MSRAGHDWGLVDRSGDPVPGHPSTVMTGGKRYQEVADAIELAATRLRQMAGGLGMVSDAVDALEERCSDVARDIEKAEKRYRAVGDALVAYATPFDHAQDESLNGVIAAEHAHDDLRRAQQSVGGAEDARRAAHRRAEQAPEGAPPADFSHVDAMVSDAHRAVADAEGRLRAARKRVDDAVEAHDSAARRARSAFDVIESDDLKDGWWDNHGRKWCEKIAKVAGLVAAVAGVLAVVVNFIPVIGQALSAILGTIALIATAVSLVANIMLAAHGDGSWKAVGLDVIALATFGIGRAVSAGVKGSASALSASSRLQAGRLVAMNPRQAARLGIDVSGGSRAALTRMLGGNAGLARMARADAQAAYATNRAVPLFNARAPFTAAWQDLRSLPSNVAFSASNFPAAMRRLFSQGPSWGSLATAVDAGADVRGALRLVAHAPSGVVPTIDLVRFGTASALSGSATLVDSGTNSANIAQGIFGGDGASPAEVLHLPESPGLR